jgi:hypothetical protein
MALMTGFWKGAPSHVKSAIGPCLTDWFTDVVPKVSKNPRTSSSLHAHFAILMSKVHKHMPHIRNSM